MTDLNIENENRLAFLPIVNPGIEAYYQKQKKLFWTAQEIDYKNDREQYDSMTNDERHYTNFLLFLFAQLDGIVNENLVTNFKQETSKFAKECSMTYAIIEAVEWTHNEAYSLLIKTFIRDPAEQVKGLNSIKHYPSIKKIADWAYSWMDSSLPLTERIIAFACIEGIIFSSAFAGIYWLKRKNILHGLCKANEWIARDEAIHTEFGIAMYHHITGIWNVMPLLSASRVQTIISSAVECTETFTRQAMNVHLVGLDADSMVEYVKTTADKLCTSLGYPVIYKAANPFDWMTIISLPNKTNFFESKVSEYTKIEDGSIDWTKIDHIDEGI
jgi:ribonucleotide reductase beta subunit family protein with ferritin-like domain